MTMLKMLALAHGEQYLCRKGCPRHSLLVSLEVSKRMILIQLVLRSSPEQVEQELHSQ